MAPVRLRLPAEREADVAREAARHGIDPAKPIVTVHVPAVPADAQAPPHVTNASGSAVAVSVICEP